MVTQQVLAPPAQAAMFLTLTVEPGAEDGVRDLLADVAGLTRAVSFRAPDDALNCIVGIGSDLWDRMYAAPRPAHLHPLEEVRGAKHVAVSTPGDLLVHLRARRMAMCFELAQQISWRLDGLATVVDEVHGFKYFDERDLLGFVDGTENPEGADAEEAVLVADDDGDAAYAGSSYVIVQKYLHDLDAWRSLSVEEQQRVIGRTKVDDIELSDDEKPANSHVALNTIEDDDGNELDIVRYNMPFGDIGRGEFGTFFIGYAADPGVIEDMLENMFVGKPPGNYDRILDFSTALTGALFFVPTADFLEDPDAVPAETAEASSGTEDDSPADEAHAGDGSLGIGSLKHLAHR